MKINGKEEKKKRREDLSVILKRAVASSCPELLDRGIRSTNLHSFDLAVSPRARDSMIYVRRDPYKACVNRAP
jgi:hypothetical protein